LTSEEIPGIQEISESLLSLSATSAAMPMVWPFIGRFQLEPIRV
jgi:hypothetical protein